MAQKKLSTGILVRDPASFNAHIDIANLNQSDKRKVMVEVYDWGIDQLWDKPVLVEPAVSVTMGPHSLSSFPVLITQSTAQPGSNLSHYEVRVTVSDIKNVVVNCFATDYSGKVIAGNTVLHNSLVEIT
jgi:hypothetical protein